MPHGPILFYMDHNEAQTTPESGEAEVADIATVNYCASLLQVNPASLLQHVLEERA